MRIEICDKTASCGKCKNKCSDYIEYVKEIEMRNLMQGNDRQPMKRDHGALKRR
jgi:hypothetical protein